MKWLEIFLISFLLMIILCIECWNNTDFMSNNRPLKPNLTAEECTYFPVARVEKLGRLGNQLSTYTNHLALQFTYGFKLYLSSEMEYNMRLLFENVTAQSSSKLKRCNLTAGIVSWDWNRLTQLLKRNTLNCSVKTEPSCLPTKARNV